MNKLFMFALLMASFNTFSQTFNVSTTSELRQALLDAAGNGKDDTIVLADGTYMTTDDGLGTFVYLTNESFTLNIVGASQSGTILSGNDQHRVLKFNGINAVADINLSKFSVTNGLIVGDGGGAGIYTELPVNLNFLNLTSNVADRGADTRSGGIGSAIRVAGGKGRITNSKISFNNNINGGQAAVHGNVDITDSVVSDNLMGAIALSCSWNSRCRLDNVYISDNTGYAIATCLDWWSLLNSTIINNNATGLSGSVIHNACAGSVYESSIANSVIINNTSRDSTFRSNQGMEISNSIFSKNVITTGGVEFYFKKNNKIINSLFIGDQNNIIFGENTEIINSVFENSISVQANNNIITNSSIDESTITGGYLSINNIYASDLGFVDALNSDYRLLDSSDLIDSGVNSYVGANIPDLDLDGRLRISGASVDIGPHEFSTTRPTINAFSYTGTAQEQSELAFSVDYTLTSPREIFSVTYDYLNDGAFSEVNTYAYNTAGTYAVTVKVSDSVGEFSVNTISVVITELPYNQMTYEQKLIEAIDPEYYNDLTALVQLQLDAEVSAATASGVATGKQYVQNNLAEFNLVTTTSSDAEVSAATASGVATGKLLVVNDPESFGVNPAVPLTSISIGSLTSGWHNLSTPVDISDMSIFVNVKIVWYFDANTNSWLSYSSNPTTQAAINNSGVDMIALIKANSGLWVEK